ncbi:MAG TPA: hypothetical protein VD695_03635 [Gaiellaceae bacterium]|nr:hypothetical protein [Gaiellaceae bacterium]
MSAGVAARERDVEGYGRAGRCDEAARLAVWVSHQHSVGGRESAARGWLARAERAVEDAGVCAGLGWVAVERARHAETVEECAEHARRALGDRQGDQRGRPRGVRRQRARARLPRRRHDRAPELDARGHARGALPHDEAVRAAAASRGAAPAAPDAARFEKEYLVAVGTRR